MNLKWTLEACKAEALKYQTRSEWSDKSASSYGSARKNKWMDECCAHMEQNRITWDLKSCRDDALKYNTRREWDKKSHKAYDAAIR